MFLDLIMADWSRPARVAPRDYRPHPQHWQGLLEDLKLPPHRLLRHRRNRRARGASATRLTHLIATRKIIPPEQAGFT